MKTTKMNNNPDLKIDASKDILSHFIINAKTNNKDYQVFDRMLGSLTTKQMLVKASVVSKYLKKNIRQDKVGIMLPALSSTSLLIMAVYMAGKVPIMLNWTVGKKVVNDCMESVGLEKVLTASSFFEKVKNQLPEKFESKCILFDKAIKNIGFGAKVSGLMAALFPSLLIKRPNPHDTAVILFTSGSETQPKAVPLTHSNVMHNIDGMTRKIKLYNNDVLLGFLPPFHSFGYTVLSVLPLISGIQVVYTPNPTDNKEIARIIKDKEPTIMLATPTFLKMILSATNEEDFASIRLAITGAEALSDGVAEQFRRISTAKLLQGYGITECSPVLTISEEDSDNLKSVGTFIPGLEHKIIDWNSGKEKKTGKDGMIVVAGKSIFNGYLDKSIETPFIELDGKQFYKTGDLGYVDANGNLYITGRLKRFIKIAGEMISLPAIEENLNLRFNIEGNETIAVEAVEKGTKPTITLFTTKKIEVKEANTYLRSKGFSNLVKIHDVKTLETIPMLATGKIDYKSLKKLLNNINKAA